MVILYSITIFLGSALLFALQPMFAKLALPLLGGSPSVWNTAMVFYQTVLLGGYTFAHLSSLQLGSKRQTLAQMPLLLVPLLVLPFAIPHGWSPPSEQNPVAWLLAMMLVSIGLPFFALSSMSPVLQKCFISTGSSRSHAPYFLFVASNSGSMATLLAYPFIIEPYFSLKQQAAGWAVAYGIFVLLAFICSIFLWHTNLPGGTAPRSPAPRSIGAETLSRARRLRWVFLAFVPSSLMLGVTTYLSSDIAVIPLMWILPLALYLLTFVIAFARRPRANPVVLSRVWSIVFVALLLAFNIHASLPVWLLLPLHLGGFTVAALLCHTLIAKDRPSTEFLTEFYLWISVGGVLGGIFNALLAPVLFRTVLEYPLVFLLVSLVGLQTGKSVSRLRITDCVFPLLLGSFTFALIRFVEKTELRQDDVIGYLLFGIPALICFFFSQRPVRFALGSAAILVAGSFYSGEKGDILHTERSFFGVHRVSLSSSGKYHMLIHGITLHGMQSMEPGRGREPLTYYFRNGPVGELLARYGSNAGEKIAVIGLGSGTLAAYALPSQSWTFYEIDPVVAKLAVDKHYFTFLSDAPGRIPVVLGDGRISLAREKVPNFNLLVLDAFSSDAIPVHLLTREAMAIYLSRLADHGIVAFHISNLHLDLEPVVAALVKDAGLTGLVRDDTFVSAEERELGKSPSIWFVAARTADDLHMLSPKLNWRRPYPNEGQPVWTDDYSSLLRIFRWK